MKELIYTSGPMTGIENFNHEEFDLNAAFLREDGWDVFSPAEMDRELGIDLSHPITEEQYQTLMRNDYRALTQCSAIAFLPGWEGSRGAKLESDFANVLKLDRYRVDARNNYFQKELVIGLAGVARVGKNTIAQEFVDNAGFEQAGFADVLKKMLYSLNPRLPDPNWAEVGDGFGHDGTVKVRDYVDKFGWEGAKSNPDIRKSLQILGTEAGRDVLGENIWISTLFSRPTDARLVISDVRYANEAAAIKQRGGYVVKIHRPGVVAANSHVSEVIDFDADFTVTNDRTPYDAYLAVVEYLSSQGVNL
jgi:hypothetical protein